MKWKTENADCTICNNSTLHTIFKKNSFEYVKCDNCSLVFASPRLKMEEINKIYSIGFEGKLEKKEGESDQSKYYPLIKTFEKFRNNNRILDIGCFNGIFLKGAKDLKWEVYGTEISSDVIEHAIENTNGGDIKCGELEDINYPDDYFDVIVLLDVIEHLPDPYKTVKEINRILRPGGLLYFDTPNFNSLERYIVGKKLHTIFPWHFYYFTPSSVKNLLKHSGFHSIDCVASGFGTFSRYNPLEDLFKKGNISDKGKRKSKIIFQLKKIRLIVLFYRMIKYLINSFFSLLSKFGIKIGAHLLVYAVKTK